MILVRGFSLFRAADKVGGCGHFLGDSHAAPNFSAPEGPFYAFDRCVLSKGGML